MPSVDALGLSQFHLRIRTIDMPFIATHHRESYLPLFKWAVRHRAQPFPKITRWQIDRNLNVLNVRGKHG